MVTLSGDLDSEMLGFPEGWTVWTMQLNDPRDDMMVVKNCYIIYDIMNII